MYDNVFYFSYLLFFQETRGWREGESAVQLINISIDDVNRFINIFSKIHLISQNNRSLNYHTLCIYCPLEARNIRINYAGLWLKA